MRPLRAVELVVSAPADLLKVVGVLGLTVLIMGVAWLDGLYRSRKK